MIVWENEVKWENGDVRPSRSGSAISAGSTLGGVVA